MTIRSKRMFLGAMTAAERAKGRYMRAPDEHPAPAPAAAPAVEEPAAAPAPDPAPAAAPAPAAEPVSFDDAFAANLDPAPAAPAPAAPAPAAPAAPAAEPAPAPAAPAAPAAPEPTGAPAPAATPTADEIVRQLAERLNVPQAPAAPAAPAAPEPVAQPPLYTAEETELMAAYQKDWPDVARAEQLTRRAEYHDMMSFMFKEVNKFVAPLFEQVRSMGNTLHTGELKTLVPDYTPAIETDVQAWIDTQPGYLQEGMKRVMQGGTSDEVADLIGRYRAASGAAPAAPAPAPAPAPAGGKPAAAPPKAPAAAPKTELSEAAKQAAASLAPVGGERSQVPAGEDQQDFDSAFARYASTTV